MSKHLGKVREERERKKKGKRKLRLPSTLSILKERKKREKKPPPPLQKKKKKVGKFMVVKENCVEMNPYYFSLSFPCKMKR